MSQSQTPEAGPEVGMLIEGPNAEGQIVVLGRIAAITGNGKNVFTMGRRVIELTEKHRWYWDGLTQIELIVKPEPELYSEVIK